MTLVEKVTTFIKKKGLVGRGDKILLAVSGGLDSVAMLDIFFTIRKDFGLELAIAHIHHGIRDHEADEDYEFVKGLCDDYGLRFFGEHVNAKQYADSQKLSLEESARVLRYEVFDKLLACTGSEKVATAHTANDQAETVLDHLLRGSGVLGMRGIQARRDCYVRPLLSVTRGELESYARQKSLRYRQDRTNEDVYFRRNRIRKELIPYLMQYFNPNLVNTLNRTAEIFSESESFLQTAADKAFKSLVSLHKKNEITLEIEPFLKYFNVVRKYVLIAACQKLGIDRNALNFDILDRMIGMIEKRHPGKRVRINDGFHLFVDHDAIVIKKNDINRPERVEFDLVNTDHLRFGDYEFSWSIREKADAASFKKNRATETLDFEKTGNRLFLRTVKPGDRFIPLNFKGHKKVYDYFSDRKIPHRQRDETPILESSKGIVWVCGHCIDDRFKVRRATRKVLVVKMKEAKHEL
ncbi:MAG: tRNA lysidine(34) synthetase TilS [bacterium]